MLIHQSVHEPEDDIWVKIHRLDQFCKFYAILGFICRSTGLQGEIASHRIVILIVSIQLALLQLWSGVQIPYQK